MSKSKKKLLVIGAGYGGLGGAWWARKAGHDVEIIEATDRPGGRAINVEFEGDRAAGAHSSSTATTALPRS